MNHEIQMTEITCIGSRGGEFTVKVDNIPIQGKFSFAVIRKNPIRPRTVTRFRFKNSILNKHVDYPKIRKQIIHELIQGIMDLKGSGITVKE